MNMNEYQDAAQRTAGAGRDEETRLAIAGLGITGEAGEVADIIKKHVGHGHELNRDDVKKELGDVLWYVAEVAYLAGFTLDEIAQANVAKLRARYPNGFTEADSINRKE